MSTFLKSPARVSRLVGYVFASILWIQAGAIARAQDPDPVPTVEYSPTITQVQGQLPINTSYPVIITPPTFFADTAPILPGAPAAVTLFVSSTTRPSEDLDVAGFVTIYSDPALLVPITGFTFGGSGIAFKRTVYVKVTYPGSAVAGPYAFKISADNPDWLAAGVRNEGTEINGSVTAPPNPPPFPPVVTIATPTDGSTIEVPGGTIFPYPVNLIFAAAPSPENANPRPITSVSADINGTPISLAPTVEKPNPVSGLATTSVSVNVTMLVSGAGAHVVTARATNDAALEAVPDVHTFTVVIKKAPLTVTAENKTKTYGDANPTLTYTYSGFMAGDTEANSVTGAPGLTTTAGQFSPVLAVGQSYAIIPALGTLSSAKYDFIFVNGGLTVNKAVLTVQPNAIANKPYGLVVTGLTATIGAGVPGDTNTPLYTGVPSLTTGATQFSLPGSYNITSAVGTLASNNYSFDYKTSTLMIAKGLITFTAVDASKVYGSANPLTFSHTSSGAVAGDPTAAYTGSPAFICNATTSAAVGSANPIVSSVGGLVSAKYDFAFVSANLSVTRAALTVTAAAKTKIQGAVNPLLTYGVTGFVLGQLETTPGVFTTVVSISTNAVTASLVGVYPIIVSSAVAPNYSISYVNANLTVTEATPPPAQYTASGTVFFDSNRDGFRNTDDAGLAGITIMLYKDVHLVASTVSAANGAYTFNVGPGNYEVDAIEVAGMLRTTGNEPSFTVTDKSIPGIAPIGLGLHFSTLHGLNGAGFSHGYWKNNLSKAIANKTSGTQETKANLIAYSNTISSLMLSPYTGTTMQTSVTTLSGTDQLKLQLLASEYNLVSGRLINNSQPLTWAFIYWGEEVSKNASSYSSAYKTFVKDWFDAFNNSHGGPVLGPTSY